MRASATDLRSNGGSTHPSVFFLLNLPFGITGGYITVVVPYARLATQRLKTAPAHCSRRIGVVECRQATRRKQTLVP